MARTMHVDNLVVSGQLKMADTAALDLTGVMTGQAAQDTNGDGGTKAMVGGAGNGTGAGGATSSTGGAGGATGAGGASSVVGGAGGATSGTGGAVALTGGATPVSGTGGAATVTGGASTTAGAGGVASVTGGAGGDTGAGGAVSVTGGASGAGATGNGGAVSVTGGAATSTDGTGGAGSVTGGAGTGTGDGGPCIITGGTAAGTGIDGRIFNRSKILFNVPTPQTATDTVSLTDAQILSGILVATPTGAATYTMRTGAQIEAALSGDLANDDSFDLTIINLGGAGDIITLAVASGVTFVGSLTLDDPATDDSFNSSGTWRFRRTAADTFVGYRIG